MEALRTWYVAHSGTCKAASGYPNALLAIRTKAKKAQHWGLQAWQCINDRILCLAWVDNNTVQYMTSGHAPEELADVYWMDPKKRHGVPVSAPESIPEETQTQDSRIKWKTGLPVPWIVHEYNKNMNGVDRHAQMIASYADERTNLRYWVALFLFILMASVVNAYRLYKIRYKACQALSHEEFRRSIATELIRRSQQYRKRDSSTRLQNSAQDVPSREHDFIKLSKKARCQSCKNRKEQRPEQKKRRPLGEISGNTRKRCVSQTSWKCGKCDTPCCRRKRRCWKDLHVLVDDDDEMSWGSEDQGDSD